MKSTCKVYEENGIEYMFNHKKLLMHMNKKKHDSLLAGEKITKQTIMGDLSEKLFVSHEAVKNWMYGYNGPSEIEQVKSLGDYFGIDYHELLDSEETNMEGKNKAINMTIDPQAYCTKERVRVIFQRMVDFFDAARINYHALGRGKNESEEAFKGRCEIAKLELRGKLNSVDKEIKYSALDIPSDFYSMLEGYVWYDMIDNIDLATGIVQSDYDPDDEYADYYDELKGYFDDNYEERYMKELKNLFSDYIVD